MNGHLLVINCDPAPGRGGFCSALAAMYAAGARASGLQVHGLETASQRFLSDGIACKVTCPAAAKIVRAASHIAIVLPLPKNYPGEGLVPAFVVEALAAYVPSEGDVHSKRAVQLVVSTDLPAFMYRARMTADNRPIEITVPGIQDVRVAFVGGIAAWSVRDTLQQLDFVRSLGRRCGEAAMVPGMARWKDVPRRILAFGARRSEDFRAQFAARMARYCRKTQVDDPDCFELARSA